MATIPRNRCQLYFGNTSSTSTRARSPNCEAILILRVIYCADILTSYDLGMNLLLRFILALVISGFFVTRDCLLHPLMGLNRISDRQLMAFVNFRYKQSIRITKQDR